jgi:hypothetical protein
MELPKKAVCTDEFICPIATPPIEFEPISTEFEAFFRHTPETGPEAELESLLVTIFVPPKLETSSSLNCGSDGGLLRISQPEFTLDDLLKSDVSKPRPNRGVHQRTTALVELTHPLANDIHKHLLVRHMFESFFQ